MQENRALMVGGAAEMMIRLCSGRTKQENRALMVGAADL
jgi:hypothetical protein